LLSDHCGIGRYYRVAERVSFVLYRRKRVLFSSVVCASVVLSYILSFSIILYVCISVCMSVCIRWPSGVGTIFVDFD
jgi:hypothetical protein